MKLMTVACSKVCMKSKADLQPSYGLSNFNSELLKLALFFPPCWPNFTSDEITTRMCFVESGHWLPRLLVTWVLP